VFCLACASLAAVSWIRLEGQRHALELFAPGSMTSLRMQSLAGLLATGAVLVLLQRRRTSLSGPRIMRWVFLSGVGGWILIVFGLEWYERAWVWRCMPALCLLAAILLALEILQQRWSGILLSMLVSLAATAIGLELGLRALAAWRPSALLARQSGSPGVNVERSRPRSGASRYYFPCNSQGHYDDEFRLRTGDERRIAVVGDSFSQGSVPHHLHYTTVAERVLGVPVDNYGVSSIGIPEYEYLLAHEVLPRDPSAVVIGLFTGNDLDLPATELHGPAERSFFDRTQVFIAFLPDRILRLRAERAANHGRTVEPVGEHAGAPSEAREELFPWVENPALEQPTMSEVSYLRVEQDRARFLSRLTSGEIEVIVAELREMQQICAPRKFLVLVIPDEFQVEDLLWKQIQARAGGLELERDRAQALLAAALERAGIEFLDPLPLMRAAEPLADGNKHFYHLQDTHWNARGNELAGRALAERLRSMLPPR